MNKQKSISKKNKKQLPQAPEPTEEKEKKYTIKELNEKLKKEIESEPNNPKHHFSMVSFMKLVKNWKFAMDSIKKCLELVPDNPDFLLEKGDIHEKMLEGEEALKCYLKVLTLCPEHREAHYRLAQLSNNKGKYEECISYIEKMLALSPKKSDLNDEAKLTNDDEIKKEGEEKLEELKEGDEEIAEKKIQSLAYELKGIALKRLNDIPGAIQAYEKSIELNPENYNVYYNKGILHQDKGELEIAKALYKKANECKDIINNNAYVNLATIYHSEDNMPEAINFFEEAVKTDPHDGEIIYNLGLIYDSLGKWEESLSHFHSLTTFPNPFSHSPELFSLIGKSLKFLGRYEEALKSYDKSLELDSYCESAAGGKAHLFCLQSKFDKALEICESLLKKKPESRDLMINKASALQGLNLFDQSLCAFDDIIKLEEPKAQNGDLAAKGYLSDAYSGKAANLMNLNNKEDALQVLNKALELNEKNASALWNKGVCLLDLQQNEEALKTFEAYNAVKPEDYKTFNTIASLLINSGNNQEALKKLEKSIELNNQVSQSYYFKGVALHNLKDYEEAIEAYDHSLVLDPKNENAKKMKKMIWEELRKLTKKED